MDWPVDRCQSLNGSAPMAQPTIIQRLLVPAPSLVEGRRSL